MRYKIINKRKTYKKIDKVLRDFDILKNYSQTERISLLAKLRMEIL